MREPGKAERSLQVRLERAVVAGLSSLPPIAQRLLAGTPVRIDGLELEAEVKLALTLLRLLIGGTKQIFSRWGWGASGWSGSEFGNNAVSCRESRDDRYVAWVEADRGADIGRRPSAWARTRARTRRNRSKRSK
jgi:alpha-beta hydrolase superfamily lysophospholipase